MPSWGTRAPEPIRFVTYLAPSLPLGLFEAVVAAVGERLGRPVSLAAEVRRSGPSGPADDPLTAGSADVAFLCPPTYLWLARHPAAAVELLPAAPVFRDARCGGRPVYFADVVVPARSGVRRLEDLRGSVWAYNDLASLSGYQCLLDWLGSVGEGPGFFRALRQSGSHLASLALVAEGAAGAAAIDSNVLAIALRRDPSLADRVRRIASWGPYPVQPVVARTALPAALRGELAAALLALHRGRVTSAALAAFGLAGFGPVAHGDYADHPALSGCRRREPPPPLTLLRRAAPPPRT